MSCKTSMLESSVVVLREKSLGRAAAKLDRRGGTWSSARFSPSSHQLARNTGFGCSASPPVSSFGSGSEGEAGGDSALD